MTKVLLSVIAFLLGGTVIIAVLHDVFEVLLLPRRVTSSRRLASAVLRPAWRLWRLTGNLFKREHRSVFLSAYGPLSIGILYVIWATLLIIAYALCEWGASQLSYRPPSLEASLYLSGSTFFTLGFGDVTPNSGLAKFMTILEAANGFGLVAAVIGYLPVLYQAYSSREAHVIRFDARAGSPPSAGFLLSQHGNAQASAELMEFLQYCETWAASLLEGQLSFPVLAFYRSHHDNQSWLAALCTTMDTCAVLLTGIKGVNSFQPRMTFAVGRIAILEMVNILCLKSAQPATSRLSPEQFIILTRALTDAQLNWDNGDAERKLNQLLLTYEPYLCAISQYLCLPLPEWSPSAAPDNWQIGEHGNLAKKLIDPEDP